MQRSCALCCSLHALLASFTCTTRVMCPQPAVCCDISDAPFHVMPHLSQADSIGISWQASLQQSLSLSLETIGMTLCLMCTACSTCQRVYLLFGAVCNVQEALHSSLAAQVLKTTNQAIVEMRLSFSIYLTIGSSTLCYWCVGTQQAS